VVGVGADDVRGASERLGKSLKGEARWQVGREKGRGEGVGARAGRARPVADWVSPVGSILSLFLFLFFFSFSLI
jgi:hypothetical protein